MKKIYIAVSALLLSGLLLVGAGAANETSQMQVARQCIAQAQAEELSEDNMWVWLEDDIYANATCLIPEKNIWWLWVTQFSEPTSWSCAFDLSTGKIVTPIVNGQIFAKGKDSLLLETIADEKYSYQVCDMKGGLRDISIPHDGKVVLADSEEYILSSFEIQKTVRTDGDKTMEYPLLEYTIQDNDGNVVLDELENVCYDTYSATMFYDDEAAVRSGSTDIFVPGDARAEMSYNAPYRFVDRSGKEIAQQKLDTVGYNQCNFRWFGMRNHKDYLLDGHGGETEIPYNWFEPSQWAEETVQQAAELGIDLPYMPGQKPYRLNIRRGEFCALAAQTISAVNPDKLPQAGKDVFPDCTDDDVLRIAALGIVTGYEDGTFQPKRDISREEAAVILHRLYTALYGETAASTERYADNGSIGVWARESVYAMRQAGIMQGEGDNKFCPQNGYTCEQALATMLRMTKAK